MLNRSGAITGTATLTPLNLLPSVLLEDCTSYDDFYGLRKIWMHVVLKFYGMKKKNILKRLSISSMF